MSSNGYGRCVRCHRPLKNPGATMGETCMRKAAREAPEARERPSEEQVKTIEKKLEDLWDD